MEISGSWESWKSTIGKAVNIGETVGLSEEKMTEIVKKIGDFLDNKIDPSNREQKLLADLWEAASEEEQRTLAHLIVRIASKHSNKSSIH